MWRIIKTSDDQHVGTILPFVEKGQALTFNNGDVVLVTQVFNAEDNKSIIACSKNYQITFVKE